MNDSLTKRVTALEARVMKLNRNLILIGLALIMTTVIALIGVAN